MKMRLCAALSLMLTAAIAAPAVAEEPLHLPGGLTIGGAGSASTQVQIFSLNNFKGSVSPSLSYPGASLSWQTGEATIVQLGTAMSRDHFSAAPIPGSTLGQSLVDRPPDSEFTLRIDHALTENVQIGGTASSQRLTTGPDGVNAQTNYVVGARLGVRF